MTTTPESQSHTDAPWWAPGGTRCTVCRRPLAGVLDVLAHQQTHDQEPTPEAVQRGPSRQGWHGGEYKCPRCGVWLTNKREPDHEETIERHDAQCIPRTVRKARPARCGTDPRASLTGGDRAAVAEFRAFLADRKRQD